MWWYWTTFNACCTCRWASQEVLVNKEPAWQCRRQTRVRSPGWEAPQEEGMVTHSSVRYWRIPWQRSLAGCSPQGHKESQRHDWSNWALTHVHVPADARGFSSLLVSPPPLFLLSLGFLKNSFLNRICVLQLSVAVHCGCALVFMMWWWVLRGRITF